MRVFLIVLVLLISMVGSSLSNSSPVDQMVVKFCQSWGHGSYFNKVAQYCKQRVPELAIEGGYYPPPQMNVMIAQITQYIFLAGIALLFFGSTIFQLLGMTAQPEWYKSMKQNQVMVGVGLFVLNNFGANLLNTGAFEIYVNNELMFSKLATKRMPSGEDLDAILRMIL